MASEEKITSAELEKVLRDKNADEYVTIAYGDLSVKVKKRLTLGEMFQFTTTVVNACFNEQGEYTPESRMIATNNAVILLYTNIELPHDLTENYAVLVRARDLVSAVEAVVDRWQLMDIEQSIDARIRVRNNANATALMQRLNDVYATIDELTEQIGDIFGGIGSEDVAALASMLANTKIDEENLVRAVIDAKKE